MVSNIYYGVYKLPKGKHYATMDQAINKGQVRRWGLLEVDEDKLIKAPRKARNKEYLERKHLTFQ